MSIFDSVIVSVEGNIGSGKSTFIKNLEHEYNSNNSKNIFENMRFIFIQEPVDDWTSIVDKNGKNMLLKFYDNQEKYSFAFQMMAYISRISLLRRAYKEHPTNTIIVTERSIHTDRHVFAKMLYDSNMIEDVEYQIYLKWFDEFIEEIPLYTMVYLRTDPITSYHRVCKRNRSGEKIDIDYLKQCHQYHEDWLCGNNTFIIDVNEEGSENNTKKWKQSFVSHLCGRLQKQHC